MTILSKSSSSSYTYQRSHIPKNSSNYNNFETVSSPLSYTDDSDLENIDSQTTNIATTTTNNNNNSMSHFNNKKELINLMVKIIIDYLNSKYNLNYNNNQTQILKKLILMLIIKCNLSLSNLTKNLLILEKIIVNFKQLDISINLLKRMVLISFIIGNNQNINTNINKIDFIKWNKLTGLPINLLRKDYNTFTFMNNVITNDISLIEITNLNNLLRVSVENYIKVA